MSSIDVVLAAMKVVETATGVVREFRDGEITADHALAKLKSMHGALDANNAAADAKLREKFEGK